MKAWLKGGLIVLGIAIVLFIILSFFGPNCKSQRDIGIDCGIYYAYSDMVLFPGSLVLDSFNFDSVGNTMITLAIFSAVFYFIVGAIIGLIVGKFKSKKEVRK